MVDKTEKFDVIIVGAGPAGIAAAYVLAEAGLQVAVLERGAYPGSKNVMGGILFSSILNKLIPNFWEEAPVERNVTKRKFSLLSSDTEISFSFKTEKYNTPPYNNSFTVLRAKFDRWFAGKAESKGAMILPDAIVDDLIWEDNICKGVKTRLDEGDLYSDVVIVAEGANAILSEKTGLRKKSTDDQMIVSVKEIISLPEEVIKSRFSLRENEGAAIEYFGDAVKGVFGNGFIYTNKDTISVGIGCSLRDSSAQKVKPDELLEHFKNHPCVRNYIGGGKVKEYLAHMIPEGGYTMRSKLVDNGLMLVGDCAGLLNPSHFHEGTNLAMASGVIAAEAIIEAKKKNDFSRKSLSRYEEKLKNSFVAKDIKKFGNFPKFLTSNPELLSEYPGLLAELLTQYFSINETSKKDIEKDIFKKFRKKIGIVKFSKMMLGLARAMGWL